MPHIAEVQALGCRFFFILKSCHFSLTELPTLKFIFNALKLIFNRVFVGIALTAKPYPTSTYGFSLLPFGGKELQ